MNMSVNKDCIEHFSSPLFYFGRLYTNPVSSTEFVSCYGTSVLCKKNLNEEIEEKCYFTGLKFATNISSSVQQKKLFKIVSYSQIFLSSVVCYQVSLLARTDICSYSWIKFVEAE